MIRNSDAFKKGAKLMIPFAPFHSDFEWEKFVSTFKFYYASNGGSWNMVGDNPIITRGNNDHDPMNCLREFIFPVSGRILLVNIDQPKIQIMPPEFGGWFNVAIIERAQRFAVCRHLDFLETMVKFYKECANDGMTMKIIPYLFSMLEPKLPDI